MSHAFAGTERFRIVRQLGAGGMGVVYEAEDLQRGQRVALKALKNASADTLYRLKNEFRALAEIQHPNLVALQELFVADDSFLTMELVDGTDFLSYVRGYDSVQGPVSGRLHCNEARLRHALPQLARGLMALHEAGKIHCDVKPSNILVNAEGRLVLLDFGLVARAEEAGPESRVGEIVGTVSYMAPEQCGGDVRLTPAADWYAVGIVLYEALTGRLPFEGPTMRVVVEKQQRAPPPPRAIMPRAPKDLDELCTALLEREPRERPDGRTVLRRLGAEARDGSTSAPRVSGTRGAGFGGRDEEIATLDRQLAAMLDLRGSTVIVRGASGMGKSALVQHFLDRARLEHPEIVLLRGRCYERESVPYQAMDSLIDDLSRYLRTLPATDAASLMPREAGLLPRLFPVLGRVSAIASSPRAREIVDPQELRTRAFAALREMLQRIGERRPLIVALDDMHWVDANTLSVLADLMRPPDPPLMLLVLATRPEGAASLELLTDRSGAASAMVDLAPLSDAAAAALAVQLLGPEASNRAADIARESSGNPFLIGELVRYVQTSDDTALGSVRLDDVILERFERLTSGGRRILEIVAVSDEPISRRALASAAEVSPDALTRELALLRSLHLIRLAVTQADERMEAFHGRIREIVLERMPSEMRRAHHKRLALALTEWNEGTTETLALLWYAAGDRARTIENAQKAADEALFRLRFDRAADLLKLVLSLGVESPAEEHTLHRRMGEALSAAGRPRDAAAAWLRSAEGADPSDRLEFRRRAADELLRGGYLEAGLAEVRAVLAEIHLRLAPTPLRALVSLLFRRAWLAIRGLRFTERPSGRIPPEELTKIDVCWSVASGLAAVDNIRGADGQSRHLALALRAGEPSRVARAFAVEATFLATTGDARGAQAVIERCRALAKRIGSDYAIAFTSFAEGFVRYFCENRWRSGVELLGEAEQLFRKSRGAGWEHDSLSLFSCLCQLYLGELDVLSRRVPALVQDAERRGDLYHAVSLRTRLNVMWLVHDEPDFAERDLDAALAAWSSTTFQVQHFFALGSRCNLALYRGQADVAEQHMALNWTPLARSMLLRVTMVRVEMDETRARIALARAAATTDRAERARFLAVARKFARRLARDPVPVAEPLGQMIEAGIAHLAGDPEGAVSALKRGLAVFDSTDTMLHASVARRRLGEILGGDEGRALLVASDAWFVQRGVRNPTRMTSLLLPAWRLPE